MRERTPSQNGKTKISIVSVPPQSYPQEYASGPPSPARMSGDLPQPMRASFASGARRISRESLTPLLPPAGFAPRGSRASQATSRPSVIYIDNEAPRGKSREFEGAVGAATLVKLPTFAELQTTIEQLRTENNSLKAEVHRLRKIEAGWFPPREGGTKITMVNTYEQHINQCVEEINILRAELGTLQADNAELSEQLQSYQDDTLLNDLRGKLAQAQFENSNMLGEMQQLNNELEAKRARVGALQAQLAQMEAGQQTAIASAQQIAAEPFKEAVAVMREEHRRVCEDLESKRLQIVSLEAQLTTVRTIERTAMDSSAAEDRDRLIEHYKLKWDEIRQDNARLRQLLLEKEEEVQQALEQSASGPSRAMKEQEWALGEAFKTEIKQLKGEVAYYKKQCQALQRRLNELSMEGGMDELREETSFHTMAGNGYTQTMQVSKSSRAYEHFGSDYEASAELDGGKTRPHQRRKTSRTTAADISVDESEGLLPRRKKSPFSKAALRI